MGVHFLYGDVVVKRGAGLEPRNQDGKAVRPPVFAAKAERMHIDASLWARVCDQVASGEAKYGHLLLLQRVVVDDLEAIYEALKHADVTVRWNRFWVSTPTLARLARRSVGAEKITELLRDDLGALHILARFRSDKTPAVRRLFQRIHGEVLPILLARLWEERNDVRRAGALAEIIGQIERRADTLRTLATQQVSATAWDLLSERLELRDDPTSQGFGQTSSSSIRDVLERFAQAAVSA